MSALHVVAIVEGAGEVAAVPRLLHRIAAQYAPGAPLVAPPPIRVPHTKLLPARRPDSKPKFAKTELERNVALATGKLRQAMAPADRGLILFLLDADEFCPAELAARFPTFDHLLPRIATRLVMPVLEYETWFVASARSLEDYLELGPDRSIPAAPETARCRKKWVEERMRGHPYSPTQDQPAMTSRMDLDACRAACPSFDKLCRDLVQLLRGE